MRKQAHILERCFFEIDVFEAGKGYVLQNRVAEIFKSKVLLRLEEVFDTLCGADKLLQIDKLDLDLGFILPNQLEEEFMARMLSGVAEAIMNDSYPRIALADNTWEHFLTFLDTGQWEGSSVIRDPKGFEEALLSILTEFRARTLKERMVESTVRERLLGQFSPVFWKQVLKNPSWAKESSELLPYLPKRWDVKNKKKFQERLDHVIGPAAKTKEKPEIPRVAAGPPSNRSKRDDGSNIFTGRPARNRQAGTSKTPTRGIAEEKQEHVIEPAAKKRKSKTSERDYFVSNAGLVLLYPFLEALFKELGWVTNDRFISRAHQTQAVNLLEYLATGREEVLEYELQLPQLLCGWPAGEVLNRFLPLSERAKQEGMKVLVDVIEYWEALEDTPIEGLQEGFLQRAGKLTRRRDRQWHLRVERHTLDILLTQLPWGLSICQLPWMEEMLFINWK